MNKTLYIIRHATAEDGGNSPMFRDFDRELTSAGIIESARMGKFLASKGIKFDLIVSSAAERAKATAKIFAEQLHYDADEIIIDDAIYGGGPRSYLSAVNQLDESASVVAIFGHNPDVTFFSEYLTRADIGGSMDKAGVVVLEFEDLKWAEVSSKMAKFAGYFSPQNITHS
ncbi:MAG: SixA phosphatase family protein [Emticicia sp.]|uniref:SixA phosphatase family protein n=1 Tax=Emticicia sp. TaxID=1930953 RepID=UPI003BA6A775